MLPRLRPFFPWASLILGLASAVYMDRSPERAWLVVVAIAGGWLGVLTFAVAGRIDLERWSGHRRTVVRFGLAASRVLALSPVQFALFFTLPFYWRAWAHDLWQGVFLAVLALAAGVTLWDPWHEAIVRRPVQGAALQGIGSFAGMNALLPLLGLSNVASLAVAATATLIVLPLIALSHAHESARRPTLLRVAPVALVFPLIAVLPPARALVPPAPLRLVSGGLGSALLDHDLVDATEIFSTAPPILVCATAVAAPRGLHDDLIHVWRHDGTVVDRISVNMTGGRDAGYRTFSVKQNLGAKPAGLWSCAVETASGQHLGERHALVAPTQPTP